MLAVRPLHGEQILLPVNADNAHIFAALHAQGLAASGVAHDVVGFVLRGPLPVGPCHLLAWHKHGELLLLLLYSAARLQLAVNPLVDLLAGAVVRRDHQGLLGPLGVSLGDSLQPLLAVRDFMHPALLLEAPNGLLDLAMGELL